MGINNRLVTIILALLLLVAIVYIATNWWQTGQTEKMQAKFQEGYNQGVANAVVQLMQQAATCQPVPLFAGNVTMNIVAVECLQRTG